MTTARPVLRAATRGSPLARWQTARVAALLGVAVEPVVVDTAGDRSPDAPIADIGAQGVFVKDVQAAVLDGRADFAVHSAKDLPSRPAPGMVLAAVPERDDPRDALVGSSLDDLPTGGRVATGSVRRRVQLANLRPDLTFAGLRGNIDTRLAKAARYDAIVMALAALRRLGREDRVAEVLDPVLMLPQVAQGALAVECRHDDASLRDRLAAIEHLPSRRAVDAERAFLAELGGTCDLPVGAHAVVGERPGEGLGEGHREGWGAAGSGRRRDLRLTAMVATLDGRIVLRASAWGRDPVELGRRVARTLLEEHGARCLFVRPLGTDAAQGQS